MSEQQQTDLLIEMEQKPENDHDFSFPEESKENLMSKYLKRRVKPYTSSRIKTRNFLSNISYTGVKDEDFVDNNFTFDTITLLTKSINPFSLERKIIDLENIVLLRRCLQKHMKVIQFVYSRCFPEIYSLIDKRGINLKSEFLLPFKAWKDKKNFSPQQQQQRIASVENSFNSVENKEVVSIKNYTIEEDKKEKKAKRKVLAEKNIKLQEATKKRRKLSLLKKSCGSV